MNVCHVNNNKGKTMAKKKKEETIEDILDRIEDDLNEVRNKLWLEREDQEDEEDDDSFDDEDEEEVSDSDAD